MRKYSLIFDDDTEDSVSEEAVEAVAEAVYTGKTVKKHINSDNDENNRSYSRSYDRSEKIAKKNERKIDRENINERYELMQANNPEAASNPYSRWKQKQEIKKEYYAAKAGQSSAASSSVSQAAKKAVKDTEEKAAEFFAKHKTGVIVVICILLAFVIGIGIFSSGVVLLQSSTSGITATTYPSEDTEMKNAEKYYCELENDLKKTINNYERTHSYNEYHYSIDEISHNPYSLISLLTAKSEGAFTAAGVKNDEQSIFNIQYELTQRVVTELRYRTETRAVTYITYYSNGTKTEHTEYHTVQVPYNYYICYVTLKNYGIEKAAESTLNDEQLSMYQIYCETQGNREDLFN